MDDLVRVLVLGVAMVGGVALFGFGAHALMRRKPELGVWRYRLRRALRLREDETDLIVKADLE